MREPYSIAVNSRNGNWQVRWSEHNGQRWITRTWETGEGDRAQAELAADAFWRSRALVEANLAEPTISQLLDKYLRAAESHRRITQSQRWSLRCVEDTLGKRTTRELTPEALDLFRRSRQKNGSLRSDGTRRRALGALISALNWAAKQKLIDPRDLPIIELPPPGRARTTFLDRADEQAFWALALADMTSEGHLSRVARFTPIALATGARAQAILDLTWDRIDHPAKGLIDFHVPGRADTNKRRTILPIADRLRPVLDRARVEAQTRNEPPSTPVCGRGALRRAWTTWRNRTPYTHITPHDLRRTWASLSAQSGKVSIYEIAEVLGDDIETTRAHYAHLMPGHLTNAINAI